MKTGSSRVPLETGLWLDTEDPREAIENRRRDGALSDAVACELERFATDGYLVLDFSDRADFMALVDRLVGDVDRLWESRPQDVAFGGERPVTSFALAAPKERRPSYRLHDLHSHSEAARALYLDGELFRWVELIFGRRAAAIQSLYFEWGSQQLLHRDPIVVPTVEPGHLLAAWIALEDVHRDAGPLVYVPGSHRYPFFEFAPNRYVFDARADQDEGIIAAAWNHDETHCTRLGLRKQTFLAKKGQVLIWHASLRHGGEAVRDPRRTRRSFVVHYSTRHDALHRGMTLELSDGSHVLDTRDTIACGDCLGLESPVKGLRL